MQPRAYVPSRVLAALLLTGACGCFRDWDHATAGNGGPSCTVSPANATWFDGFENGLTAWLSPEFDETVAVVPHGTDGVPQLACGGANMARFQTTTRTAGMSGAGRLKHEFGNGSSCPTQVTGTYRAWVYLPAGSIVPNQIGLFAFRAEVPSSTMGGALVETPQWFVALDPSAALGIDAGSGIGARAGHYNDFMTDPGGYHPGTPAPLTTGRWSEVRAHLVDGVQVDFALDGVALGGGPASHSPIGCASITGAADWLLVVGHDSPDPGTLYLDNVSFTAE